MDAVIIAFVSGKGGTGTSTAAVLTGEALAALEKKVLYIELKPALRSADVIGGISGKTVFDLSDVMEGRCTVEKAAVPSIRQEGFWLLCAPYEDGTLAKRPLDALLKEQSSRYDYILLDASGGLDEAFALATEAAQRVVLVLTPDPAALRIGQLLVGQPELADKPVRLLLNRVIPQRALANGVLQDLDEAIDTVGAQLLGVIPDSAGIQVATTGGAALPGFGTERSVFKAIAKRLLGEEVPLVYRG
ncbi:AAA family ATPase [Ruminococcaceae bacterium OttesenSCG-928-I18]|nr:AAA family ATPase [Ruminococcaceae bacterium OttesenSCG-928-I18]